jgi:hypothetical protein
VGVTGAASAWTTPFSSTELTITAPSWPCAAEAAAKANAAPVAAVRATARKRPIPNSGIDEKDKGRDGCSLATLKPLVDVNHDGQASIAKITKPRCLNGGQCYAKVRDEVKTSVITPFQNNNKLWERARAKAGVELLFILYQYPMWDSQSTPSSRSGHDI